jgi:hypothetical protein
MLLKETNRDNEKDRQKKRTTQITVTLKVVKMFYTRKIIKNLKNAVSKLMNQFRSHNELKNHRVINSIWFQ